MFRRVYSDLMAFSILALTLPSLGAAVPIVRSIGGDSTAASIQATVDQFRADLGDPNNGNSLGPLPGGRREINWDGGGDAAPFAVIAPDLFNAVVPRGAVFDTPGTGVAISGQPNPEFGNLNPDYPDIFSTFSAPRLFTALDSTIVDQFFFIPGTNIPAATSGFGAVFTDVDLIGSTSIEYFDLNDMSLGVFDVPVGAVPDASLSFLGVSFGGPIVSRVRITSGNTPVGPDDDPSIGIDVVVMDDFLFGEPQQVLEPTTLLLLGTGLVGLAVRRKIPRQ